MNRLALALLSLLLIAATPSPHLGTDEHEEHPTKHDDAVQQQQVEIQAEIEGLRTTVREFETALLESINGVKKQAEADAIQHHADHESWSAPPVLLTMALVIVGLCYTIFAGFQWWAIGRQAEATEAALHINRPYIVVEKLWFDESVPSGPRSFTFDEKGRPTLVIPKIKVKSLSLTYRNVGTGPADVCIRWSSNAQQPRPNLNGRICRSITR